MGSIGSLKVNKAQPSLLYDITPASMAARLEQLGVVLACGPQEARDVALQQPVS